jgi:hypothetical protein
VPRRIVACHLSMSFQQRLQRRSKPKQQKNPRGIGKRCPTLETAVPLLSSSAYPPDFYLLFRVRTSYEKTAIIMPIRRIDKEKSFDYAENRTSTFILCVLAGEILRNGPFFKVPKTRSNTVKKMDFWIKIQYFIHLNFLNLAIY